MANASVVQIDGRHAAVLRKYLSMFQNISDSADGVDEWMGGVVVNFAAKAVDMDIYNIGCGIDAHLPYMVENHAAGDDAPGVPAEVFQKRKLLGRQL